MSKQKPTIMKKLLLILVLFASVANAQIVNIPDPVFKASLLIPTVDTDGDGEIQLSEALVVDYLIVSAIGITDLTGIEAFANMTFFDISNTSITTLNLTMLSNLGGLTCNNNNLLTSVNMSNMPSLGSISCNSNTNLSSLDITGTMNLGTFTCVNSRLTSVDVSGRANLMNLNCQNNLINSINFTNCPSLDNINLENNAIPSLDLTGLTNITFLHYTNNQVAEIIVTNPVVISEIIGDNNQLTDLDFSKVRINYLFIPNNPLVSLNLKNGFNETISNITINSNSLQFVCEDENQVAALAIQLTSFPNVNPVVNSYCSFTPGGNYNTITGTVTFDANANGCDSNDAPQPNLRVNITNASGTGASFTNSNGNYNFYTQTGSFIVTPNIENPTWFNFTPSTATIPLVNNNNNVVTQNFCLSANGIHPDVEVVVTPIGQARPGFEATYQLVYKNKGNQTLSGSAQLVYNDDILDFAESDVVPSSQSSGLLTYNYTNLLPFESRRIYIMLYVDPGLVNIGDQLVFDASISPIAGDESASNNEFQYSQTVVGLFDPNDITCVEGNIIPPSEIGNYLHYVIRFENTGTADAENIVVKEIIDANQFDVSSLQIMNSSTPMTAKLTGNVAEFIFQNINLHSGGHGNILLKVRSNGNLVQGNTISKRANIYFDYNAPVATNLENTTFQNLSNPDVPIDASISVYPNPTRGNLNINCSNIIKSVSLYDIQGRLLQTSMVSENQTTIDITSHSAGIYFVKVISDYGMKVQKIVRE